MAHPYQRCALTPHDGLGELLLGLQMIYANDGTASALGAATVIGRAVAQLQETPLLLLNSITDWLPSLALDPHPLCTPLRAAAPLIHWTHAGLEDAKIPAEVARAMLTTELIGPDGLIFDAEHRIGLFYQAPGLAYRARSHAAEEVYLILAGACDWTLEDEAAPATRAGDMRIHPSYALHSSATSTLPMLSAWRWAGDISWDSYRCVG